MTDPVGSTRPGTPPPAPIADRDSSDWWAALAEHRLLVQRCDVCGLLRWPARAMCGGCASFAWTWQKATGRARAVSWIVNRHRFGEVFPSPYVVVLAALAEQDDLVVPATYLGGHDGLDGDGHEDDGLEVGCSLVLGFQDIEDGDHRFTLVGWAVAPIASIDGEDRSPDARST